MDLAKMRTRGGGGQKSPENYADVLYVWPPIANCHTVPFWVTRAKARGSMDGTSEVRAKQEDNGWVHLWKKFLYIMLKFQKHLEMGGDGVKRENQVSRWLERLD